jgi:hypothetical protein
MERIHKRTSAQSEGINEPTIGIMDTEVTETVRFLSGETIISSQHSVDYLYLMRQGKAKICLTHENGKLSIIEFIGSGEYLGETDVSWNRDAAERRHCIEGMHLPAGADGIRDEAVFLRCGFSVRLIAISGEKTDAAFLVSEQDAEL